MRCLAADGRRDASALAQERRRPPREAGQPDRPIRPAPACWRLLRRAPRTLCIAGPPPIWLGPPNGGRFALAVDVAESKGVGAIAGARCSAARDPIGARLAQHASPPCARWMGLYPRGVIPCCLHVNHENVLPPPQPSPTTPPRRALLPAALCWPRRARHLVWIGGALSAVGPSWPEGYPSASPTCLHRGARIMSHLDQSASAVLNEFSRRMR